MKERRWTALEMIAMPTNEFRVFALCVQTRAFRLLGISWKKRIEVSHDPINGDLVVRYE